MVTNFGQPVVHGRVRTLDENAPALAQRFTTGGDRGNFEATQIGFKVAAVNEDDGFDVTAGLYTANASGRRGRKIAELVAPTPIRAYRRNYWEVPDGIILEPDTSYFVVLRCDLGSTDAEICNGGEYIRIRVVVDDDEDDVDHGVDEGLFDGWSIANRGYWGVWGGMTPDDASHAIEIKGYSARIPYIIDNGVTVTSTPGDGGDSYSYGETIEITVRLSRAILVDFDPIVLENSIGIVITQDRPLYPDLAPSLRFRLGDPGEAQDRYAHYAGGNYTNTLIFHYIVTSGDTDSDGIEIPGGDVAFGHNLPSAFQGDTTLLDANLEFPALGVQMDHKVDGTPKIDTVNLAEPVRITSVPAIGTTYRNREVVEVTVTFDQPVLVTPPVQASIGIDGGSGRKRRGAAYSHGSGTESVAFQYVVVQDDSDTDGIEILPNLLAQGGDPDHVDGVQGSGDITSLRGNLAVNLASSGVPDDSGHKVDGSMSGRHVEVVPKKLAVDEGDSAGYMVWLTKEPSGSVTVTVDGFSGTDVSVNSASLTFTTLDWSTNQTVTVTAGEDDDALDDDDPPVTLTHTVAGGGYGSAAADDVTVTVRDNDRQGVTVSAMALTVPEGGTAEYTVVLSAEPAKDVTVKVAGASGDVSIDGDRVLTFTSVNWNDPQTVTVRAAEDDDAVADDPVTLTNALAGGGSARVTVTVTENDTTRATVTIGGFSNATTTPENAAWTSPSPTATGGIGAVTWSKSGADAALFTQASDGGLTLGAQDYETPADADGDNVYEATVVATDADQNTDWQSIEVTVTDVIETSTVTISGLSNATTPENVAWTSPSPTATGAIGAVIWTSSGADAALFTLASDGGLTLGAQDYETPADADGDNVYAATVVATDADANEDTHSLEVTVTDVIETSTVTIGGFSNATTTPENVSWTSPTPTVMGAIGAVTWSKSGADAGLFTLASGGRLTLGAQDYETPADADNDNVYEATVTVTDADANEDTHSLEVTVTDVVETSTVTIGGLSYATTPENAAWTSPVPTAAGAIGAVTWTRSGADAGLFTLASDGRLTLLAQDYEAPADADVDGVYEVTLRAVDADANEDTHSLEVTVADVVETATVTIGGLSNATTPENAAWTSPSPTATGGIGAVTWSKSGADAALFTLASDGRLTLGAQDYETPADADADGVYEVTLRAVDADANEDTHSLEVTVTDVVETATVTIGGLSNATTPENAAWTSPSPTATGGIGAVTWTKSGADAALFTQASDGRLTLGAQDYETPADADGDNVYEATVVATDADQNTDGQSIEVTVTDVIETSTVTIGSLSNATAPENSTWTSPIPTAAGAIGAVTWSKSGTDARLFTLGADGQMMLGAQDYESPADADTDNVYEATVTVTDADANEDTHSLEVTVTDVVETATVTIGGLSNATTPENAAWTSPSPTATGGIGAVTWSKSGADAALFTLASDGRLTLPAQDYEAPTDVNLDNDYQVTVRAQDADANAAQVSITISVTDSTETSTVTVGGLSDASTPENAAWTSPVPTAAGAIGAVTWSKSGPDAGLFTQAPDGRLTLGAQDYETHADANADNVYEVTPTATDGDGNVGARSIGVVVTDVVEMSTVTVGGLSNATTPENSTWTSPAPTASGAIGAVTWGKSGADAALFTQAADGRLTLGAQDYETPADANADNVYAVTVTATDADDNVGAHLIEVQVTNVFEPSTVTIGGLSDASTPENVSWRSPAPTVSGAVDEVTWSKSGADADEFTLAANGRLTLPAQDYETPADADGDSGYEVTLRVRDAEGNEGAQSIEVAVTDVVERSTVTIEGPSDATTPENRAWTSPLPRAAGAIGAVTWSKSGPDADEFTVALDGRLTLRAQDFDAPVDANADNVYEVTLRAQDADGNADTHSIRVTVYEVFAVEGDLDLDGPGDGNEGRLQIFHKGRWGTVCDDTLDNRDNIAVEFACRLMGYETGELVSNEGRPQAPSGMKIWLDDVRCYEGSTHWTGEPPTKLSHCYHAGWGLNNCSHAEDAWLRCTGVAEAGESAVPGAATVRGARLTLRYDAALDGGSVPSGRDFVVIAGPPGGASAVPVTSVAVGGEAVVLTLERPVLPDETVYVSYLVAPMHPVQDTSGSRAAPLADLAVRNETRIAAPRRLEAAAAAASPGAATALPVSGPAPPREPLDLSPWLADGGASAPLGRLDLSSRTISDIGALAGLTALRVLRLEDNGVVDLGPLSALTGLRVLDLSSNAIADVGPLSALTELERLNLSGNRIADVSALSGLTGLEVLLLHGNRIDDVLPLWSLQGLLHLGLAGNRVADIGLLAELASLQRLDLTGNRVSDVSPLGDLSRLVWLRLAGNPVAQMSPLGRLTLLRWLWLDAGAVGREALKAPGRAHGTPLRIEGVPARQRNGEQ